MMKSVTLLFVATTLEATNYIVDSSHALKFQQRLSTPSQARWLQSQEKSIFENEKESIFEDDRHRFYKIVVLNLVEKYDAIAKRKGLTRHAHKDHPFFLGDVSNKEIEDAIKNFGPKNACALRMLENDEDKIMLALGLKTMRDIIKYKEDDHDSVNFSKLVTINEIGEKIHSAADLSYPDRLIIELKQFGKVYKWIEDTVFYHYL